MYFEKSFFEVQVREKVRGHAMEKRKEAIQMENECSLFGLYQDLRTQGKTEYAEAVRSRFESAWARADVTLSASRF